MRSTARPFCCLFAFLLHAGMTAVAAEPTGWKDLSGTDALEAWRKPQGAWFVAGSVRPDPNNPKRLTAGEGRGVLVNGKDGKTSNLLSKESFGDHEVRLEFLIPKGSNSGVKFHGVYEIQIADSAGVKNPTADDC